MTGVSRRRPTAARLRRTARDTGTRRIRVTLIVYALVLLVVVGQLVHIQVVDADTYADRGVAQRARTIDLPATRGRIYDRDGDVLATSVQSATLYADPRVYRARTTPDGIEVPPAATATDVAAELAPVIGRDVGELTERLARDAHFVYVARQLDWEVGQAVLDLDLPGIDLLVEPRRVYPAGGLAGQVVGFTGIDGEGLQGLESRYDDVLRGEAGTLAVERAPGGLDIVSGLREVEPALPGTDLVLTLDREVQHLAERAVDDALETHGAAGASVVVLEVGTGQLLAMASAPGFDPNDRVDGDQALWRNRAVTDVFEPGSTQKALTMAAAIDGGIVSADAVQPVGDRITVGGSTFTDAYPHPTRDLSISEVIERSSNVGTIQVARDLGAERLHAALLDFGYGRTLGVGFPGESPGLLMPTEQWWGTSLPTIAIGQGVAVTLLHMAHSYAVLANDGVAVAPRIVRGTVEEDGRLTDAPPPTPQRVVAADTAQAVTSMLVEAVSGEHGTGARAAIPGYQVAGKTGTARKPDADAGGYSDEYVATFVGYAPASDPRFVVAVMVDEPSPVIYGGLVAAPVFREVMQGTLMAMRVPPDTVAATLDDAMQQAREQAALAAEAAAEREGPATPDDDPASPPVGSPAGGDGTPVGDEPGADAAQASGAYGTGAPDGSPDDDP